MPTVDTSVFTMLAKLAVARGANEVAEAIGDSVEAGLLAATIVWSLDSPEGPLRPLYAAGIEPDDIGWKPRPHSPKSALWRALELGQSRSLDTLPPELEATGVPYWSIHVLNDPDGTHIGVALCGRRSEDRPNGLDLVIKVLGPTLHRTLTSHRERARSEMLTHILELMSDGVIVATTDGDLLAYNPALEQMTGWTKADIKKFGWTNLVYPDPIVRADLQRGIVALVMGTPSEGVVRSLARKDGTELSAAIWSRLLSLPSNSAHILLGVIRDSTNEQIARRRAVWEESHAQLGRLAGGMAHEFNNLLAAIMGHADIIAMRTADANIQGHAQTILRSAERGADLSTQLLAFSGTNNSRTAAVPVHTLVEQAVDLFSPRVPEAVALRASIDAALPPVEVDASQIQQVLINILGNAVDALDGSGSITISADLAPIPQSVRYRSPHAPDSSVEMARIRVRDDGPGFSPDALANLFVPFYSGKPQGHGVGLPAVRGLIGAHGGAIDVNNDPGAVIDFYLPISSRPELSLPTLMASVEGNAERVWLVDDQSSILEFAHITLESRGYAIRTFSTVASVSAALADLDPEEEPQVVVLDVIMPDGGGLAVYKQLIQADIPARIVWISGHTPDDVELPLSTPIFLQKPFSGADLAATVQRALLSS